MATDPLSPFAQGVVDNAMQATFPQRQNPDPFNESILGVLNERSKEPAVGSSSSGEPQAFSKQFFGVDSPDQILKPVGPSSKDPNTIIYEFAGDGKRYNAPADKTPEEVLEAIWDHNSPGIWGAAKGATLYSMPSELSSALAYSLEGVGMENLGKEWHEYADQLKNDYQKNYGQFTVPDVQSAWDQGKLYDFALQTIGAGAPYMGLALAGGGAGGYLAAGSAGMKAGTAAARLGSFFGAAGVTAPVTIAQFADRQVQALKEQGVENPKDHIDWTKAATLGTVAAGLQAIPVDSIIFAGPVLNTLEKWGVDLGSKMSTRLLGNMADVAGTNAFVGMGTSALSRMNADMPLLDDEAKAEYFNAGVMGTLVGVPFGLYKGYRYQPKPKTPVQPIDSSFLGDPRPERPVSEAASTMKEDIIYGYDQTTPQAALPPPVSGIIRDPNADYGITDRVQAAEYLRNIKYKDKKGEERDGLSDLYNHFETNLNRPPSDRDLIEAARKASFVRSRESFLKRTPNGVMYKDIDDQPQVHSNDEKILTKAAALTDQFGYQDTVVRNFSDDMINKLYRINVQRDLDKAGAKYPDEIRKKVMEDFENFVDKKVMEDVQQYGSIYKRPDAQERINKNIKAANQMLSENPRKKLAETLMNKRRSEAEKKQYAASKGARPEDVISHFDDGAPIILYHGTMPDSAKAIDESGEFNPQTGKRAYYYSEFGDFSSYFSKNPNSFWFDQDAEARRAVAYPEKIKAFLKPSARIFTIKTFEDAQRLAKMLGYTDRMSEPMRKFDDTRFGGEKGNPDFWVHPDGTAMDHQVFPTTKPRKQDAVDQMMRDFAVDFDSVDEAGTKVTAADQRARMAEMKAKLQKLNIDALDIREGFASYEEHVEGRMPFSDLPTSDQFIVFNHDVIKPSKYGLIRKRPGNPPINQPFYGEDRVPRSPKRSSYWKDLDGNTRKRSDMDNYARYIEDVPIEFLEKIKGNKLRMTREEMEALKKDIQENGLNNPLIVNVGADSRTAKLGEGNHRLQALKELGYTHAPVRISVGQKWGSELNNSGLIDGLLIPEKGKYFKSEAKPSEVFRTGPVPKQKLLDLPVEPVKPIAPTSTEMKWAGAKEATKKYEADMRDYRKALKEYKQKLKEVQEENVRIQRRNESTGVKDIYPKAPDKVTSRGGKFIEEPPVDGEAFGPYAGMRSDPMAIRGLLEYKPAQTAEALAKAATMPGPNATPKLKKSQVIEALLRSPLFKRMLEDKHTTTDELRRIANRYWKERNKPIISDTLADTIDTSPKPGEFRYDPKAFKGTPRAPQRAKLSDVSEQILNQLHDEVDKLAMERNADFLKRNPDLGPALNEMFKKFAEMSANVKVSEKPRIMRATKKFSEQVMNRVKLLNTIENAFNKVHPSLSKLFRQSFDKMLSGKEMDKATFNAMLTSLHTAFNINKPKNLNEEALATWYKNMRQFLPDKTIDALNKNRQFFSEWYGAQEGVNPKDLGTFRTEDLEAMAFAKYLKGDLNVNIKDFKDIKQKKIFSAFEKSFKQLNKEFADIGYKKLDDILEYNDSPEVFEQNSREVPPEARRPNVFADRVLDEVNRPKQEQAEVKVEEIKEAATEAGASSPPPNFKDPQTRSGRDSNDPFLRSEANNIGTAGGAMSFLFSVAKMARKHPIIGRVHNIFVKQKDVAANIDLAFTKQFDYVYKDLANKDMDKIIRAGDIIDHLRNTKQGIKEDTQGRIVFKDENDADVVLSKVDSDIVKGVSDFFKVGIREDMSVTRELLEHFRKEYNVGKDSSLLHLQDTIDNIEKLIKNNPLPEFRNKYVRDRDMLQEFHDQLKHSEALLARDVAYIPHMRFGDYVVWVKDRKTGNLVHMEVLDNTDNLLGLKTSALPSKKHADQKIDKLGLRKKYDPKDFELTHGQLTYNSAAKLIQKGMLSMELIQSLNATGLERNIELAHMLATGVKDPQSFMKAWSEDAGSTKNHIMRYVLAQGKGKYLMRAQDEPVISGYSRDWDHVMDAYKNTFKNSIARKATAMELAAAQKDIVLSDKVAPELKKYANNYVDYMLNPSTDYGALRNFNFFWTMGYRLSTAMLQIATLPTQAAGVLVGYTGNPLSAMSYLSKGISKLVKMQPGDKNSEFFNAHPGYFRQSMTEDAIAKEINTDYISHLGPGAKQAEKGFNFIKNNAGFFVSNTENFTRKSTFIAFRDMFKDSPEITRKAIKDLATDYDWQYFWDTNKTKMDVEDAMALYHMRLVHAEFGKTGRGPMQRGLFGTLAFPFMTYPQQMLELLFEQMTAKKGAAGVLAGLYTMGAYVAFSGLNGIPAYDLWKTLYEEYEEKVNGRMVDLNMQLEAAGMPEFLRRGALSTTFGLDMSSRLSQDIIGQNLLMGLLKDEIKIGEITGVPGRTLVEMMNGAADVLSGSSSKSALEKIQPFMPSVGKDVAKTAQMVTEPENYWKTKSGKILKDTNEDGTRPFDVLGQLTGFTPLEKTQERERLYMQQRANQEFTGWKSRLAERVATAEYLMYLGSTQDDNEKYQEGREMRADVTKDLREYAKANGIRLDSNFWRGFRSSVQERLWQKKNPGKIKKPTQQERRYQNILTRDKE